MQSKTNSTIQNALEKYRNITSVWYYSYGVWTSFFWTFALHPNTEVPQEVFDSDPIFLLLSTFLINHASWTKSGPAKSLKPFTWKHEPGDRWPSCGYIVRLMNGGNYLPCHPSKEYDTSTTCLSWSRCYREWRGPQVDINSWQSCAGLAAHKKRSRRAELFQMTWTCSFTPS